MLCIAVCVLKDESPVLSLALTMDCMKNGTTSSSVRSRTSNQFLEWRTTKRGLSIRMVPVTKVVQRTEHFERWSVLLTTQIRDMIRMQEERCNTITRAETLRWEIGSPEQSAREVLRINTAISQHD